MRRITYWALSTLSALVLLLGYHTSTSSQAATSAQYSAAAPAQTGTASSGTTSSGTGSSTGTSGSSSSSAGSAAASSTITGDVAQTRWGPVQVRLTVTGGRVTAVDVVEHPNGNGRDQQINAQALPILVEETLDAQSASIDMVSGATVTSTGYTTSLQSALDQAGL